MVNRKKQRADSNLPDELKLSTFALYIRRENALKWGVWGLASGLAAAALVNLLARLFPLLIFEPRLALSLGLPALGALGALLAAYLYPWPPTAVAQVSDTRLDLRARLATALEIDAGQISTTPDIAARQRADAAQAAQSADPKAAFRLVFPQRPALIAAILLVALIVGLALPNPQEQVIAQNKAEQAMIEKQIERLEEVKKEIEANPNLSAGDKETLLKEIDETIRDLEKGNLSKEEAVARLSETEETLKELLDPDAQAAQAALDEAGRQAALDENTQPVGEALAQGDYQGAAEALETLGEKLPQMSAEELTSLAERLEAMAAAVEATNPELAQALRDAAAALRQGNIAAAQEALQRAAALTEQAGQEIAAQQATEQTLGQVQEGRREIAQTGEGNKETGQGNQGQQGQGQQGQGQSNQGNDGQGNQGQNGQGQDTGNGSGTGDSNGQGGQGTPQSPTGPIDPNGPGAPGEKEYDPVYAPERLGEGEGGDQVKVSGTGDDNGPPTEEVDGGPHDPGQALVPYDQVYTDYQAQAASALENSYIPRGMKDYVRDYFSAIEPGR